MLFKNRKVLWSGNEVIPAKRSNTYTVSFDSGELQDTPEQSRFKLRLRGDVDVQQNWMWEGGYPLLYRDIDDALCTDTHHSQFCLKLDMDTHLGRNYPRRAYCKLPCPLELTPQFEVPGGGIGNWEFSIWAKADNVTLQNATRVLPKGKQGVTLEIWNRVEGLLPTDINRAPEKTLTLEIDGGSYDWKQYKMPVEITTDMAMILVTIYADNSLGCLCLEDPRLCGGNNQQVMPQLTNSNPHHEYLNWMGENISRKEWTKLRPVINGEKLPVAELFQRCHRGCEHEIPLPMGVIKPGVNTIKLCNENEGTSPLPFRIMEVELLSELATPFQVIWFPSRAVLGKNAAILVETCEDNITLTLSASSHEIKFPEAVTFKKAGLHVIKGMAEEYATDIAVTISGNGFAEDYRIERVITRGEDNVITGTSDSIYIPQDDIQLMREFLAWYFENRVGNFISFRPVYRWTGARVLAPEMWEEIRDICTELEIPFCHIIDGRELPGLNANPTKKMLESPYFVGNQGHERDGALYYWRQRRAEGTDLTFHEVSAKRHQHEDYDYGVPICYTKNGNFLYFDPISPKDMKQAAEQYIEKSRLFLAGIKRHTGPSVLFKYFFEAGLEVGGAEIMYGPQEIILSALRGASLAYNRKEMAAHLAVQWSSTPHDTVERFRRYQLSLFDCYLQGVNHINTEEGLYRMEELFSVYDRFTEGCKGHLKVQQEFTEFVETHTRRGKMYNPIAILHGRYDGWVCFTRPNVWAHSGEEWKFSQAEESWDLLKLYYPNSKLQALYVHPCPNSPQGFFSKTPYTNVDILPIEAEQRILNQYPFMAFLGYNAATESQLDALYEYVSKGGKLLLTLAHLNTAITREDIIAGEPVFPGDDNDDNNEKLKKLLGCSVKVDGGVAPTDARTGVIEELCDTARVIQSSASGQPLVIQNKVLKGEVIWINTAEYPAHPMIRDTYEAYLKQLTLSTIEMEYQKGWMTSSDTVQSGVYLLEDGTRVIYAVNTNWWAADTEKADATLHIGGAEIAVSIPRGVITTVTINEGVAAITSDITTEVLSVTQGAIELQGYNDAEIRVIKKGSTSVDSIKVKLKGRSRVEL